MHDVTAVSVTARVSSEVVFDTSKTAPSTSPEINPKILSDTCLITASDTAAAAAADNAGKRRGVLKTSMRVSTDARVRMLIAVFHGGFDDSIKSLPSPLYGGSLPVTASAYIDSAASACTMQREAAMSSQLFNTEMTETSDA